MNSAARLRSRSGRSQSRLRVFATISLTLLGLGAAAAQAVDCARLQADIAAGSHGDPAAAARYAAAARKQQYELDRTTSYAAQIGCNNRQFLFFGSAPPPQCGGLEQQIARMRANVANLQAQAQQASGEGQRQALLARFETYCRPKRGFFDSIFGDQVQQPPQDVPPVMVEEPAPRGGSKAVCVRTCDGGFFPVSYSAGRASTENLQELCHALCPNAETQLFTYSPNADIEQAVGVDGTPYKSLPNALKYRTKYDPTCTCKPPNKSWVQALADAELLLGRSSRNDIIVTEQKAAELSRPTPAREPAASRGKRKEDPKAAAAKAEEDPTLAAEAAANANAPTASNASAGIADDKTAAARSYGVHDGETREETDANGKKRKVRIIGPSL